MYPAQVFAVVLNVVMAVHILGRAVKTCNNNSLRKLKVTGCYYHPVSRLQFVFQEVLFPTRWV